MQHNKLISQKALAIYVARAKGGQVKKLNYFPLTASFSDFPALKRGAFEAAIFIG